MSCTVRQRGARRLIIIDMQNDFLHPEGLFSSLGYNVTEMRELNPTIHNVLELSPERGLFVVHTRQGWRADLSDLPSAMRGRSKNGETEFGSPGPMGLFLVHGEKEARHRPRIPATRGQYSCRQGRKRSVLWDRFGFDPAVPKPRVHRNLDGRLHPQREQATIETGNVSLLLEDCRAATVRSNHVAAVSTIKREGRYFGSVGSSQPFPGGT